VDWTLDLFIFVYLTHQFTALPQRLSNIETLFLKAARAGEWNRNLLIFVYFSRHSTASQQPPPTHTHNETPFLEVALAWDLLIFVNFSPRSFSASRPAVQCAHTSTAIGSQPRFCCSHGRRPSLRTQIWSSVTCFRSDVSCVSVKSLYMLQINFLQVTYTFHWLQIQFNG
jgi:hypothetical protein